MLRSNDPAQGGWAEYEEYTGRQICGSRRKIADELFAPSWREGRPWPRTCEALQAQGVKDVETRVFGE